MNVSHLRSGLSEFLLHACLGMIWWNISAVLFERLLLQRTGFFRTDRGSQADEEWEMRAALSSDIAFLPGKLATWRIHDKQASSRLRAPNRTNLDCLEAVLNDPNSGIPNVWRMEPGWQEKITAIGRTEYQDGYGLYRSVLRHTPGKFARAFFLALFREPAFLRSRVRHGFDWDSSYSPDPIAHAQTLLGLFQAPWPPTRLDWRDPAAQQRSGDSYAQSS